MLIAVRTVHNKMLAFSSEKKNNKFKYKSMIFRTLWTVTLNNASNYWVNGLLLDYIGWTNGLLDYIGWTNGLTDYWTNGLLD